MTEIVNADLESLNVTFMHFPIETYSQTSAQIEYDKTVSVFVRSICVTQRKIVSNSCFKQCSNKYCLRNIVF